MSSTNSVEMAKIQEHLGSRYLPRAEDINIEIRVNDEVIPEKDVILVIEGIGCVVYLDSLYRQYCPKVITGFVEVTFDRLDAVKDRELIEECRKAFQDGKESQDPCDTKDPSSPKVPGFWKRFKFGRKK